MKLTDIVVREAIVTELRSGERDDVIAELLEALTRAGVVETALQDELRAQVLDREQRGSTGFGKGVAVPHVKHEKLAGLCAAIGLSEAGVEFNSLDKRPVHSVFLLLSPVDKPEEHLQAMEIIFKHLSKDTFRRFLRQATTIDEVQTLLEDADAHRLAE